MAPDIFFFWNAGFSLLKEMLGSTAFFNQGYPSVVMTDDSDAGINRFIMLIFNCYKHKSQYI